MFFDLNIPYDPATDGVRNDRLKLCLAQYTTFETDIVVGLNYTTPYEPNEDAIRDLRSKYHIVSVLARNQQVFTAACRSPGLDIISFEGRLTFRPDPGLFEEAKQNNIWFELSYAPSIRDTTMRFHFFQHAKELLAGTRQLIITSRANDVSEIRGPSDVFYLSKAMGLADDQAKFATGRNCQHMLKNCTLDIPSSCK
ncbi:RNase P subunit p30-domain-containing protein [Syncephalastrum racemosum]|uniref:RNase P subunit p30-domain-containing protein n=1 Tax=Syncephalastrum racemosum TaxID=13706 RepID=A0A1X2H715_SYNRA|nr:RNase P subunit p30-domain-containing protein [Syncephalastrum racemosum]